MNTAYRYMTLVLTSMAKKGPLTVDSFSTFRECPVILDSKLLQASKQTN